ncbi:MAG TPA: type I methionyl aminopeptidase [Candidatus Woesebacteria bacterium]|nr:type I methionyl aminopeptidase [Candidatus Woesebacteria bacterium]
MTKLQAMTEGGARLGWIKGQLVAALKAGVTPLEIEFLADRLIKEGGDKASFKMEAGYHHATCININDGMVHGIPNKTPFKAGDVVKIDLGLFHHGYHVDTAITVQIPPLDPRITGFLDVGRKAENAAIAVALPGNTVYDISQAMQQTVEGAGFSSIRDLTGHGIGRKLHMDPWIPCFADKQNKKDILSVDQTIAIETMYAMGDWHLVEDPDGWTISTQDGSLTGYFEETVYITQNGPIILTAIN